MRKFIAYLLIWAVVLHPISHAYANVSAIQNRAVSVAATPIPAQHQACFDIYAGCMDEFCTGNNVNAGRCQCSNDFAAHDASWQTLQQREQEILRHTDRAIELAQIGNRIDIVQPATPQTQAQAQNRARD
ncbi:MAG: hypothetical protein FWC83_02780, partial [Alphaproteobacteria bacterium]|nr:hypothetical protein [Alphaproteobacteria bacterium]